MHIRATFERTTLDDLAPLRAQYLDGLIASQEALLETFLPGAELFRIQARGETCGYLATHDDRLIEFHVTAPFLAYAHLLLADFVAAHPVRSALVKSFDHLFLSCAMDLQIGVQSRGALVRDYLPRPLPDIPRIRYRQRTAGEEDLPRIRAVDQNVFTHPERLQAVVRQGFLRLFEKEAGEGGTVIGFGVVRPVIPGRPQVDVGIAVDRAFRNRGYAVYMMRDMVEHCRSQGFQPVGGCSMDNEPSKQMGLRVGLVARYRLLELRFR